MTQGRVKSILSRRGKEDLVTLKLVKGECSDPEESKGDPVTQTQVKGKLMREKGEGDQVAQGLWSIDR